MLPSHVANERRRKSEEEVTRVKPGDSVNTKCLFFLDVGRMSAASRDSIQFHMVSYCSTIKVTAFKLQLIYATVKT